MVYLFYKEGNDQVLSSDRKRQTFMATKLTLLITDHQDPDGSLAYGLFDTIDEARAEIKNAAALFNDEPRDSFDSDEDYASYLEDAATFASELMECGHSGDHSVTFLPVAGLEG